MLALLAQAGMPDSVRVTGEPSPALLFGGRTLSIAHLKGPPGVDSAQIGPGDLLGTVEPRPAPLSKHHQRELDSASVLYQRRDYAGAAAILAPAYADERDNPFIADEYARTLFWIDNRRNESFDAYRRLIAQLDKQHGTNDKQVAVDAWFSEAYWKIASLYLDREDWKNAAFEIARFLSVRSTDASAEALTQVYSYFAEATTKLDRKDLTRWAAQQSLRANPRNTHAIEYLRQLGREARDWPATHVFACRVAADSLPCLGGYAFHRSPQGLLCTVPNQEPRTPLSPCLRIGWVYVGQYRRYVEAVLGAPWKDSPIDRGDGTHSVGYLVFADGDRGSYYIVEFERLGTEEIAHSVQFTGDSTPLPIDFSGMRPGDPAARVLAQLGAPETRGQFNDQGMGLKGEWWDWPSNTISFEIVDGRVYSIRVWRPSAVPPAAIQRAFMRLH
jgi:hypothetical protein